MRQVSETSGGVVSSVTLQRVRAAMAAVLALLRERKGTTFRGRSIRRRRTSGTLSLGLGGGEEGGLECVLEVLEGGRPFEEKRRRGESN